MQAISTPNSASSSVPPTGLVGRLLSNHPPNEPLQLEYMPYQYAAKTLERADQSRSRTITAAPSDSNSSNDERRGRSNRQSFIQRYPIVTLAIVMWLVARLYELVLGMDDESDHKQGSEASRRRQKSNGSSGGGSSGGSGNSNNDTTNDSTNASRGGSSSSSSSSSGNAGGTTGGGGVTRRSVIPEDQLGETAGGTHPLRRWLERVLGMGSGLVDPKQQQITPTQLDRYKEVLDASTLALSAQCVSVCAASCLMLCYVCLISMIILTCPTQCRTATPTLRERE
jgi:hypothetical protein